MDINNGLVVQSLNYHGQQLTNFVKNLPEFQDLQLASVDYGLYQSRSNELRREDRGRRLLVHQFISTQFKSLFRSSSRKEAAKEPTDEEDAKAIVPPLETFFRVDSDERARHFFDTVQPQDLLLCRVAAKNAQGLLLNCLGFAPGAGKSRYVRDLRIKCFCPSEELLPHVRAYDGGDVVCVFVLEVKKENQRLLVGMKSDAIKDEVARAKVEKAKTPLGICRDQEDLPILFNYAEQVLKKKLTYSEVLEKNKGFENPSNVEVLTEELGLSNTAGVSSLFPNLQYEFPESQKAPGLRKAQASKMAFKHVAAGIKYFKNGNEIEAMQCLNQALKIDAENVEGLVARGALYANKGSLERAIEDFEVALKINAQHKNARKYMCETLFAFGKEQEEENKEEDAVATYERILKINSEHEKAREAIDSIRGLARDAEEFGIDLNAFKGNKEMCEKFKAFIKAEKEKKMMRQQSPPMVQPQQRRSLSPKRSLSPFSQKISLKNPETLLADPQASSSSQMNIANADIALPNMSVPPPNLIAGYQKTEAELEYERKVAAFISKTTNEEKPDNLDKKIEKHLDTKPSSGSSRKRRTFTDFPVYDNDKQQHPSTSYDTKDKRTERSKSWSKGKAKDEDFVPQSSSHDTKDKRTERSQTWCKAKDQDEDVSRTVSYKGSPCKVEFDPLMGMYKKVIPKSVSEERIVRIQVSKSPASPSPPPQKRSKRSPTPDRRRSKDHHHYKDDREYSRSKDDRDYRSRDRDRNRSRSRSRDRHHSRSNRRSPSPKRKSSSRRSPSPMSKKYQSRSRNRDYRSRSRSNERRNKGSDDTDIKRIMDETENLKRQRERVEREKAALLKSSGAAINLPTPVPLRAKQEKKEERKEISMKVNSKAKVIESKKWEVEDDEDEEDEMNEALNNVRSAVDHRSASSKSSNKIDPATASKILPGAQSLHDIEAYLERQKREKLDQLKNRRKW